MKSRAAATVGAALADGAALQGDKAFLVMTAASGELRSIGWAEMDARATRTARLLRSLGLRVGDRFNVHTTNCPEFFDLWFGAARLGAVLVPTDPRCTSDELAYVLGRSRCHLTVTRPELQEVVARAQVQAPDCGHLLVIGDSGDETFTAARDAQADAPWDPLQNPEPRPEDVLGALCIAEPGQQPKNVLVTHATYLDVGRTAAAHLRMGPNDRQFIALPLSDHDTQCHASMSALVSGGSIALVPRFSVARWSAQAGAMGATLACLVAEPVRQLCTRGVRPADSAHTLRAVTVTQPGAEEYVARFEEQFSVPVVRGHERPARQHRSTTRTTRTS
ncbi:AMP-binding protein [Streptomyces sp. NPDC058316]|uniref:AMP-binding protein n=1 Tax=unclassified Streptomyces TaxID=2593676 RepID=UPI00331FD93D